MRVGLIPNYADSGPGVLLDGVSENSPAEKAGLQAGDTGTIGITFHAQKELGDIVYVDLPKPGTMTEKGKTLGSVESVKAVSEIYSPVSGEVKEVNGALTDTPELVNQEPHGSFDRAIGLNSSSSYEPRQFP